MDCVGMVFEEYLSSEYLTFQGLIRFLATITTWLRSRSVHKGHSLVELCMVTDGQLTENILGSCCLCNIYHLVTCQSAMSFTFIGSHLNHLLQSYLIPETSFLCLLKLVNNIGFLWLLVAAFLMITFMARSPQEVACCRSTEKAPYFKGTSDGTSFLMLHCVLLFINNMLFYRKTSNSIQRSATLCACSAATRVLWDAVLLLRLA